MRAVPRHSIGILALLPPAVVARVYTLPPVHPAVDALLPRAAHSTSASGTSAPSPTSTGTTTSTGNGTTKNPTIEITGGLGSDGGIKTCQPINLTWHSITPPVQIAVYNIFTANVLRQLPELNGNDGTVSWLVDVVPSESVQIGIYDGTGLNSYSPQLPVTAGASVSCVGEGAVIISTVGSGSAAGPTTSDGTLKGTATTGASTSTGAAASDGAGSAKTSRNGPPPGAIAGMTITGCLLVAAVIAGFYYGRRSGARRAAAYFFSRSGAPNHDPEKPPLPPSTSPGSAQTHESCPSTLSIGWSEKQHSPNTNSPISNHTRQTSVTVPEVQIASPTVERLRQLPGRAGPGRPELWTVSECDLFPDEYPAFHGSGSRR